MRLSVRCFVNRVALIHAPVRVLTTISQAVMLGRLRGPVARKICERRPKAEEHDDDLRALDRGIDGTATWLHRCPVEMMPIHDVAALYPRG